MIDSGVSRHFTRYKEALSNLIKKKTNLEIILRDNATYPMKGIGIVTLHLNQGQTHHSLMERYAFGKETLKMHLHFDLGLKVS